MTDEQLADFLGLKKDDPLRAKVANLSPELRAKYESMAKKILEIQLYDQGLGPKPEGVIVCREHKHRREGTQNG
jgi:hypothetical protein